MTENDLHFRIFDRQITVSCEDEQLAQLVLANYAAFRTPAAPPDLGYRIGRNPSGGFYIDDDDERPIDTDNDDDIRYLVVYGLEKLLTVALQTLRTDLYFVHAAVLERDGRSIMIAAESGTGKSTTSWALLQHGFDYLSDELAPVDPDSLKVHPYPHALCLKATPPGPYALPAGIATTERTLHVPTALLPAQVVQQPSGLQALIFLQRDATASVPTFSEVTPAEASARLYANTLNALAHPGHGLDTAIRIASAVPAYNVHAGELQATCELISELVDRLQRAAC